MCQSWRARVGEGVSAVALRTTVANFAQHHDALLEECFGPLTLLVEYDSLDEVYPAPRVHRGLAHRDSARRRPRSGAEVARLVEILSERAGRVLFDGWPTGVAVTWGQHHGGPWPATTSQHTSVGGTAIRRFLRPVAFQHAPEFALPADLTDEVLRGIPHRRDGRVVVPTETRTAE